MSQRLAVTMWEFSWLTRRSGKENEYADPDRVLDELIDRGYNAVRIDAFPHLVHAETTTDERRFAVAPQGDDFMWGNHGGFVEVRDVGVNLVSWVTKAAERGVRVGLSTWFNDDETHQRNLIRTAGDLTRVWETTLRLLDDAGLLTAIEWVDLCNEWPLTDWVPEIGKKIFPSGRSALEEGGDGPWSIEERERVSSYFSAIDPLRARWPQLRYTFSYAPSGPSLFDLDVSRFDLLEPHIWLETSAPEFGERVRAARAGAPFPEFYQNEVDALDKVYWPHREQWWPLLHERMRQWSEYAQRHGLPLYTTEAWSSICMDTFTSAAGRSSWDYVKDVAEAAVPAAIELGWSAIATSNFSEPHFAEFWADVEWHRRVTALIRGA